MLRNELGLRRRATYLNTATGAVDPHNVGGTIRAPLPPMRNVRIILAGLAIKCPTLVSAHAEQLEAFTNYLDGPSEARRAGRAFDSRGKWPRRRPARALSGACSGWWVAGGEFERFEDGDVAGGCAMSLPDDCWVRRTVKPGAASRLRICSVKMT